MGTVHEHRAASQAVVDAVAEAEGVSPLELRPLARAIDSDALDALVASMDGRPDGSAGVEFAYGGYLVTVTGDGRVHVRERADAE